METDGILLIRETPDGYGFTLLDGDAPLVFSPVYTTLDSTKRSIRAVTACPQDLPVGDHTRPADRKLPNPKIEVYSGGGDWFFRLRARNGKQTLTSRMYPDRAGCLAGIARFLALVAVAPVLMETPGGRVPIADYTAAQVARFEAGMFRRQEGAPPADNGSAPAAAGQDNTEKPGGLRGLIHRIFR